MARTAEQKAADEALTEALEQVRAAYDTDGESAGMTMAEYVVVQSLHGWDDEGDSKTSVAIVYRDGDVPMHRAMGLLHHALGDMNDYRSCCRGEGGD